ncbi:hypothetical protein MKK69_25545 [Methylobacterium sp. J-026]|uniref:hypothetical protein n=1 Tax=Methylobacterium sp. J-026 TaxID=2836624 RepID=UPI001FBA56E9|nr:hypothetical protein [Methylobacterium sp. J-026]MCJ2137368.1 hypothetical protein [Methylobacterium sp. J-026]
MDMSTPKEMAMTSAACDHATLARVAQVLGCSPDHFYEPTPAGTPRGTSHLIQMWLAISSQEGRDAVFAFAREVLQSEKSSSHPPRMFSPE